MKTYLILILSLLISPLITHAQVLSIGGHVTDIESGDPVIYQEIVIAIDSSTSGTYNYFNIVYTNEQGYYSDIIFVPEDESGQINVSIASCGVIVDTTYWFTPDTQTLGFDFEICSNPGGNYCQAFFDYFKGEQPLSIQFVDSSAGDVSSWIWDFGDGNMSMDQHPVHTYLNEGNYFVSLFIGTVDSCSSFFGDFVWVGNDTTYCNAEFNVILDTLNNVPHTYIFTDNSEGEIESWYWEFGDGNFSFDQNPVHVYDEGGTYEVCLTISTNPHGSVCTSDECKMISTLEHYNFGGQVFTGNYPINVDSTDNSNVAIAYLYRKINHSWEFMDKMDFWKYGYYWFSQKPVGEYLIKTELKENSLDYFNYAPAYYFDATDWNNASVFTLVDDQQFAVNISFHELATFFSGIGSLSGKVIGGPSCDTLQNIDTEHVLIQLFNNSGELINYTYSDEDGRYEFTGLGMGNYSIKPEYTGRYTEAANITISNTEPSDDGIDIIIYCSHILDISEIINEKQIQVNLPYPNPANDFVKLQINSKQKTSGFISIYNLKGNLVHNKTLEIREGNQIITAQISTLPSGLYSMEISLNNYKFRKFYKIIIIH